MASTMPSRRPPSRDPALHLSFETRTSTIGSGQPRPQRSQGSGIFGTAINLLGGMLGAQQAAQQRRREQARQPYVEDMAYGDFEEEEEDDEAGRT